MIDDEVSLYALRMSSYICSPSELRSKLKKCLKSQQLGVLTQSQDDQLDTVLNIAQIRNVV